MFFSGKGTNSLPTRWSIIARQIPTLMSCMEHLWEGRRQQTINMLMSEPVIFDTIFIYDYFDVLKLVKKISSFYKNISQIQRVWVEAHWRFK